MKGSSRIKTCTKRIQCKTSVWRIHQSMDVGLASVLRNLRQMEAGILSGRTILCNLVRKNRQFMIPTIFSTVNMQKIFSPQRVITNIMSASFGKMVAHQTSLHCLHAHLSSDARNIVSINYFFRRGTMPMVST